MASLPARQQSQPRCSSPERGQEAPSSPSLARSAHSEDSQTLFLNDPEKATSQQVSGFAPQPPTDRDSDPNIKKCWICFSDSTEDTPESSPWRDPCPCALVAHEECLLDWIADTESPSNARRARASGFAGPKIECPQCKHEIRLARPRNYAVDAVRGVERLGARAVTPGALGVLSATLWNASTAMGFHSIYSIFGAEDGFRILRPMIVNFVRPAVETEPRDALNTVAGLVLDRLVHWRLYMGLPLIAPVLILSRTRFADSVLPVLPILFFATQTHAIDDGGLDFTHWPPSASLSFAVLPYIRQAYNMYWEKVWAEKEKRWLKEIQPRTTQTQDGDGADGAVEGDAQQAAQGGNDDNVFEVRIDGGIWEDWGNANEAGEAEGIAASDNEEDPGQPQPDAQANRVPAPVPGPQYLPDGTPDTDAAEPPPNIADNRPGGQVGVDEPHVPQPPPPQQQQQQPPNAVNANGGERRLSFSPTAIAETVLGALLFPTLAGMSGELLKLVLPRAWTMPGPSSRALPIPNSGLEILVRNPARGLLQEKWGRSLVGGCLFVVVKDFLGLYVKWKMVEMHRKRRVVDYDRSRGRVGS